MPCEQYQTALIEAAATAVLPSALREHLANCADCRAALVAEQKLFASIDVALSAAANVELPPAFLSRVQAHIKDEKQSHEKYNWIPSWALAAVSAAVILLALTFPLMKSKSHQLVPNPTTTVQKTLNNPTTQQAIRNSIPEAATEPKIQNLSASTAVKHSITPRNDTPQFASEPEVIVPPDEREAFSRFVAMVEQTHGLASAIPSPVVQSERTLQVDLVEIAAVHVEPLNPETELTDFFGRTHGTQ